MKHLAIILTTVAVIASEAKTRQKRSASSFALGQDAPPDRSAYTVNYISPVASYAANFAAPALSYASTRHNLRVSHNLGPNHQTLPGSYSTNVVHHDSPFVSYTAPEVNHPARVVSYGAKIFSGSGFRNRAPGVSYSASTVDVYSRPEVKIGYSSRIAENAPAVNYFKTQQGYSRFQNKFTEASHNPSLSQAHTPTSVTNETASKNDEAKAIASKHSRGGWWKTLSDWWFPHKAANTSEHSSALFPRLDKWRETWQGRQTLKNNRIFVIEVHVNTPVGYPSAASAHTLQH